MKNIIKGFVATEKALKLLSERNTLTMLVDNRVNKTTIKKVIEDRFNVKVDSVNIVNIKNKKKAYVKLTKDYNAEEVASKFGLI